MPSVFKQFNTALTYLGVEAGPVAWGLAQAGVSDVDLVDFLEEVTRKKVNGIGEEEP